LVEVVGTVDLEQGYRPDMSKQTILLIDAHPIWRQGVMSLIKHVN
jgi:hypothetical protein